MLKLSATFFLLGMTFGIGPCLFSCGPFLIAYICGTEKKPLESFFAYLIFSLSRVSVYVFLSVLAVVFKLSLELLELYSVSRIIFVISGAAMIFLGALMAIGRNAALPICEKLHKFFIGKDVKTLLFLGALIGLAPCAPLISVIGYLTVVSKSIIQAIFFSFSFGVGTLFSPLIFLAVCAGMVPVFLMKKAKIVKAIGILSGIIILILGVVTIIQSL